VEDVEKIVESVAVGTTFKKSFEDGTYVGTVKTFDSETGWCHISCTDGDEEDLRWVELKPCVGRGTTTSTTYKIVTKPVRASFVPLPMKNVPGDVLALALAYLVQVAVVARPFTAHTTPPAEGCHLPRRKTLCARQVFAPRKSEAFHLRVESVPPLHV
jgi:hypothetical protein